MFSDMKQPTVLIGIVTFNSADHIGRCLESIQSQDFNNLDIIILDNCSTDGTVILLNESWADLRLIINQENIGFGRAHNRIIAELETYDYYMPINPDVILPTDYVSHMVACLEQAGNEFGWASGKLLFSNSQGIPTDKIYTVGHAVSPDGYAVNIGYQETDENQYCKEREIFGANAAAPLYRHSMLKDIQTREGDVFDPQIFLYGEDVDLDWRARLLGWKCIYNPKAVGYHVQGASGGGRSSAVRLIVTANRYYVAFKYNYLVDILWFNIPLFILHILFMSLTEPRRGFRTLSSLLERVSEISYQRRWMNERRIMTRNELHAWFRWSRQQRGTQATNYVERFWSRKIKPLLNKASSK